MKYKNIISLFALLFASTALFAQADDWGASDEDKAVQLQVEFNKMNINGGAALFNTHCKACHGEAGAGKPILPNAVDLGTEEFNKSHTDGLIFYKLHKGKGAMPSFQGTISDEEMWKVIAYIRSNYEAYEPPAEITAPVEASSGGAMFEGDISKIDFSVDEESGKLSAKIIGKNTEGQNVLASGVPLEFRVVGYFGDLPLNKDGKTDEKGEISFDFPKDLPSDTAGMIELYAAIPESAGYGKHQSDVVEAQMGEKLEWIPPLSKRSLWGPLKNIPLWLLFTYLGITGLVWLGIFYVVLQLFKIWMLRER